MPDPKADDLDRVVDIWKYVVSVQMHFNDMEMKVRNLYFTILAATIGLLGVVAGHRSTFNLMALKVEVAISILVMGGVIGVSFLFYFIDQHWYHRLLKAAVGQAGEIEAKYGALLPEIGLGTKVSAGSPVKFSGLLKLLFFWIRDPRFRKAGMLHSDGKIQLLYGAVIVTAVVLGLAYSLTGGVSFSVMKRQAASTFAPLGAGVTPVVSTESSLGPQGSSEPSGATPSEPTVSVSP